MGIHCHFASGLDFVDHSSQIWMPAQQLSAVFASLKESRGPRESSCFGSQASSFMKLLFPANPGSLDALFDYEPEWRFWKWLPPVDHRQPTVTSQADNYAAYMANFKDYLVKDEKRVYDTSLLKAFATLELPDIVSYVEEPSMPRMANSVRSYFLFKDGIWPMWEDAYNAEGGCWTLRLTNRWETPAQMWKQLILILCHTQMKEYLEEICGVGLTIRRTSRAGPERFTYKLSIWNRDADNFLVKMQIGAIFRSLLPSSRARLCYLSHRTNMSMQSVYSKPGAKRRLSHGSVPAFAPKKVSFAPGVVVYGPETNSVSDESSN